MRTTDADRGLRTIRGFVASDGSITRGVGFSTQRAGVGNMVVRWTEPFRSPPVVTATLLGSGLIVFPVVPDRFYAQFYIYNTAGANVDLAFNLHAVGPPV